MGASTTTRLKYKIHCFEPDFSSLYYKRYIIQLDNDYRELRLSDSDLSSMVVKWWFEIPDLDVIMQTMASTRYSIISTSRETDVCANIVSIIMRRNCYLKLDRAKHCSFNAELNDLS